MKLNFGVILLIGFYVLGCTPKDKEALDSDKGVNNTQAVTASAQKKEVLTPEQEADLFRAAELADQARVRAIVQKREKQLAAFVASRFIYRNGKIIVLDDMPLTANEKLSFEYIKRAYQAIKKNIFVAQETKAITTFEGESVIVTFEKKLKPGTRGADHTAKVTFEAATGKITSILM